MSELLQLKSRKRYTSKLQYISLPTLRTDNQNVAHTVSHLSTMLEELKIQVMNNNNITAEQ